MMKIAKPFAVVVRSAGVTRQQAFSGWDVAYRCFRWASCRGFECCQLVRVRDGFVYYSL